MCSSISSFAIAPYQYLFVTMDLGPATDTLSVKPSVSVEPQENDWQQTIDDALKTELLDFLQPVDITSRHRSHWPASYTDEEQQFKTSRNALLRLADRQYGLYYDSDGTESLDDAVHCNAFAEFSASAPSELCYRDSPRHVSATSSISLASTLETPASPATPATLTVDKKPQLRRHDSRADGHTLPQSTKTLTAVALKKAPVNEIMPSREHTRRQQQQSSKLISVSPLRIMSASRVASAAKETAAPADQGCAAVPLERPAVTTSSLTLEEATDSSSLEQNENTIHDISDHPTTDVKPLPSSVAVADTTNPATRMRQKRRWSDAEAQDPYESFENVKLPAFPTTKYKLSRSKDEARSEAGSSLTLTSNPEPENKAIQKSQSVGGEAERRWPDSLNAVCKRIQTMRVDSSHNNHGDAYSSGRCDSPPRLSLPRMSKLYIDDPIFEGLFDSKQSDGGAPPKRRKPVLANAMYTTTSPFCHRQVYPAKDIIVEPKPKPKVSFLLDNDFCQVFSRSPGFGLNHK